MRIVSMAVAALFAMAAGALADQKPTQKKAVPALPNSSLELVKADGWLLAGRTEADSPCIGDVSTPKCSVETLMVCFVRNRDDWCSAAFGEPYTFYGNIPGDYYNLYRFLLIEPIRKARYFQEPDNGGSGGAHGVHTQAGDFHIVVLKRDCEGEFRRVGNNICNKRAYKMHYFVHQQAGGNWAVIGGFTDYPGKARLL